jgi:hypothetical protein
MNLFGIKSPTTFKGMVTNSRIDFQCKTMMRRSQTWRVIYTRWDKTVVYTTAWFYKVDKTIYSKAYAGTGGLLIFKADSLKGKK